MLYDQINAAQRARKIECDPFFYEAEWNTLAGNAVTAVNVSIQTDSDFVITKSTLCAYTAASVYLVDADYQISFLDTGSGRALQNQNVHVHNIMGVDGGHPFIWPEPKLLKGGTVLSITLTNLTAVAARVNVTLAGFKIYYYPGFSRELIGTI